MYNRYIPGTKGYTRVVVDEASGTADHAGDRPHSRPESHRREHGQGVRNTGAGQKERDIVRDMTGALGFLGGKNQNAGMTGILKSLHLEELDSGDILLLLIILFLFLEGDNTELVITLGLLLLLGLGDEGKENQKE